MESFKEEEEMSVKPGFGGSPLSCPFPSIPSYLQQAHQFFPPKRLSHAQLPELLEDAPCQALLSPAVVVPGCFSEALGGPRCPRDKATPRVALTRLSVAQWFLMTIYPHHSPPAFLPT